MIATASSFAPLFYRVWDPDGIGNIKQLYEARHLEGVLSLRSQVKVKTGDFAGRTMTIKQVVGSDDWQALAKLQGQGYALPSDLMEVAPVETPERRRFEACDAAIGRFFNSTLEAAQALYEMDRDNLWRVGGFPSLAAYWEAKEGEFKAVYGETIATIGYSRAHQLIQAGRTLAELPPDVDKTAFSSEVQLRALRSIPEGQRPGVARAVVEEVKAAGRPLTEQIVKSSAADTLSGLSLAEVQEKFAGFGWQLSPYAPRNRQTAKFRFVGETEGKSVLFESLWEASNYCDRTLAGWTTRSCLYCLQCSTSDERLGGADAIWCNAKSTDVDYGRVAEVGAHCALWRSKTDEAPAALDAKTAARDRMTSNSGTTATDEHNTPRKYWQPALDMWGASEFDLDPATNPESGVPAKVKFFKENDGLSRSWQVAPRVRMWANFPFSLNEDFTSKFAAEYEAGHLAEAVILDKSDSRTAWGQRLLNLCSASCRIYGYTQFVGAEHSATFPVEVFYFGPEVGAFYRAYQHLGLVTIPVVEELIAE